MNILTLDFQQDHFQLFNLPSLFKIDSAALERSFLELQAQVHPDKFAHLSEAERRLSMQWATRVNEGYQTLRNPQSRARYLLSLHGVDTQEESNTAMPTDFLMQQMEWREALEAARQAKDNSALEELEQRMQHEVRNLQQQLAIDMDETRDYTAASGIVRKLRFLEKLAEEIGSAFDELDS
ncbi:Fe-S protein assembly co-chaperone HscB [Sideroxydans lithotrophicus]|uniref:Co-chaperone protein HscB homolog n=1 Tax=Sideroxydans lithotrophicus (strain ES-1) TaxID=580332 RepID=D5CLN5_SIDLE|nr:Fe-S protein assembly co-chaperone HscB [Sideroxydans lithotrophicus]ADE12480.1 co-chaperone Hsc20 [Sideroxydans lithotrophicus ES-1]